MLVCGVQVLVSLTALLYYWNRRLRYLAVATSAYFIAYYIEGSFDLTLPLYFILLLLGMGVPRKLCPADMALGLWTALYAAAGVLFQDWFPAITTAVTRFGCLIIFLVMVSEKKSDPLWEADSTDFRFAVRTGLLTELLTAALVWREYGFGTRVVNGSQPIGAGIAVGIIMLIGWCYLKKMFSSAEAVVYSCASVIAAVISGTRGYMVIICLSLIVPLFIWLFDVHEGEKAYLRIGILGLAAAVMAMFLFVSDQGGMLVRIFRINAGVGYRENENIFVKELMLRAPWYNQLFGMGFGGDAGRVPGFMEAVYKASGSREFMVEKLIHGTIFHNYWYTVMFKTGIVGLVVIFVFFVRVVRSIFLAEKQYREKWMIALTLTGYLVSLTFRITATCSMLDFLLAAFLIRQLDKDKKEVDI